MRHKNRRWLFVWAVMYSIMGVLECELVKNSTRQATENVKNTTKFQEARSVFSPRMDYEQWTPIGRGDPLKNDPTYDYVPPILEHVHYWVDPSSRKPDPQSEANAETTADGGNPPKTEILVLGVSSKKPSVQPPVAAPSADSRRDVYDPYFKYVESGTKFTQNHYQSQRERIYFPNPYYFPSSGYHKNKHDRYKGISQSQSQIPYTILMPPPLPRTETPLLRPTTDPSANVQNVQVQAGNLVYHASTISNSIRDVRDEENYHTADSTSVTWRTPLVVSHQHMNKRPQPLPLLGPISLSSTSRPEIYKMGKVENAHMDAMNTYVNIGKPEAHIQSEITIPTSNNLINLLKKEATKKEKVMELNPNIPSTMASFLANIPKATTKSYTTTTTITTPSPPTPTTVSQILTTDPLFKHYKQPAEPLRGPMYLIIQGHSKVKTYGPAKQLYGINVQDLNEISNYDKDAYKDFPVKHLHSYRKKEEYHPITRTINARGRALDLSQLSLADVVQTGYGAIDEIDITEQPQVNTEETTLEDIKETDLVAKFQVASEDITQEEYHKGIVEEVTKDPRV
ncbi:uncharacterized protein [Atheta coriaria]|uniref:uncharacterized protein n=1 Tax=Dalotia coriaria TaxID=877792 RepID=UPI0031F4690A